MAVTRKTPPVPEALPLMPGAAQADSRGVRFGVRTPLPDISLRERALLVKRIGFDGIELGREWLNQPTEAIQKQLDGTGVAVNAYLWRASLDTINFIPLVSADPFGGVIITDWYTPSETPNERMKVQVTILDRELRADGVRVSVFKQTTSPRGGGWVDAQVDPRTNIDIENAILTRARQLRIAGGS